MACSDPALFDYALRLGDNCLVLGHRVSEWCGHSPVLEEDIALANQALDLIGQTTLWLGLAGELEGEGRSADDLAFLRDARAFRNVLLVEQPNGDFGQTLMRQFLFDAWHYFTLQHLAQVDETRVAEIAGKAFKEVAYHLERSTDMVIRLGDGTDESRRRMQEALDVLWRFTGEMFETDATEQALIERAIAPDPAAIEAAWQRHVQAALEQATLELPGDTYMQKGGRTGMHSEHLGYILAEMQFLQRAYPGARW